METSSESTEKQAARARDLDLVRRCVDRDEAAWAEFLDTFGPVIRATIYRTLTGFNFQFRDQDTFEDIYLENLRSLLENIGKFNGRSSLRTWLTVCVRNLTVNEIRKIARKNLPDSKVDNAENSQLSNGKGLEDRLEARNLIEKIELRLFERISPKGKIFYELIFHSELSVDEIARTMKISKDGVRVWKKRLRDTIMEIYQEM